ncbi:MAG: RecX family transcriptional regulator [Rikenellaceae bacterium]
MPRQESSKVKTPEKALETLEWLCSKMERCVQDARRSLYRWGVVDRAVQDSIIEKLTRDGFIDERRYAAAYVRDKVLSGRWGESKIRYGLRAKGILEAVVESAIAENLDKASQSDKLYNAIYSHYQKEKGKTVDSYSLRAKLFRRAASRGFELDEINSTINKVIKDEE